MAEPKQVRWPVAAVFAAGVALAALTVFGGVAAALGGVLAQPAFALAAAGWRRRDELITKSAWQRDGLWLTALWTAGAVLVAVAVAWPLSSLTRTGSLSAALGLSTAVAVIILGLWRVWPLWHALERDGGDLRQGWQALGELEAGAWRGLLVATVVALLAAAVVVLAWPGLVAGSGRWVLATLFVIASPVSHFVLQQVEPADDLMVLGDDLGEDAHADTEADTDTAIVDGEPLEPALYAAVRAGRAERALELIAAGADPHAPPPVQDRDQRSLSVLAAVLPDLRLLRELIARGVSLNVAYAGLTPLLAACRDSWHGRPDAVMTLLANGADPRATDNEGNTPLHHAARSADPGVAALLRDAAAEIDVINHDGLSPLGVACEAGNWRLARFLLERGARPEPAGGQPALLSAARGEDDDPAGVQLLLKQKAKVNARDPQGRTALHEASYAGHIEIVDALLGAGADVVALNRHGRNALLEAARGGHLPVLERLLDHLPHGGIAEASVVDADGRNALSLAVLADSASPTLIHRLLEIGLDPDKRDGEDKRPVERAAEAGRWGLVAALDAGYALPASIGEAEGGEPPVDRPPALLLREALRDGHEQDLESLVPLLGVDELGALLHDDESLPAPDQVVWLLARGAHAEVRDGAGDTPMSAWLSRGPAAQGPLRALLDRGVSPAGAGGLARFLAACAANEHAARGLEPLALELLERGADPFAASRAGDPPLALSVRLGWSRLLDRLLAIGVDLNVRDSHGMSALHLAAALGREVILKKLVAQGASPDVLAADGQTPLGVALSSGRRDLADWLDWRGWPLPQRPLQAEDVPAAAIVGDVDAVRRLLDLGLPVDAADNQGCTALLRAAGGGHRAVVDLLLARGADPRLAANSGATPLSAAVSMRHVEIVDRLISAGAATEQRLPGELTALMVACALGLPELTARLLAAGADPHARDAQGRTPLHCAAMFGFSARERTRLVALLDTLLLSGSESDLDVAAAGATPLLLLLGARAEPGSAADEDVLIAGLELLLDHDARFEVQDPRGFGPLHLAALHGLLRVVQWLLRAGADPDLRDALNRTPREIAVMRGFVDIAAEFVPVAQGHAHDVSMARFLRDQR